LKAKLIGGPQGSTDLNLQVSLYQTGTFRVKITEMKERWQPNDLLQTLVAARYDVLTKGDKRLPDTLLAVDSSSYLALFAKENKYESVLVLYLSPLKIELYVNKQLQVCNIYIYISFILLIRFIVLYCIYVLGDIK
jgi:hypothetical protein